MAMHALHAPYQNQLRGLEELNEKTHAWVLLYSTAAAAELGRHLNA